VGVAVSVHKKFGVDISTGFRTGRDESLNSGLLWNTCSGWTWAFFWSAIGPRWCHIECRAPKMSGHDCLAMAAIHFVGPADDFSSYGRHAAIYSVVLWAWPRFFANNSVPECLTSKRLNGDKSGITCFII
jgi:hypothetical protein